MAGAGGDPGRRGLRAAFVYMRRHLVSIPPIVAATGQLARGRAAVPGGAGHLAGRRRVADAHPGGSILMLGVLGTGVAYVLNYRIIADLGATKASLVTYIIPVVAVVVGILVLDEPFEGGSSSAAR